MYSLNFVFILFYRLRFWLIFILFCIFIIVIKIELILSLRELSVDYSGDNESIYLKKILDSIIIFGNVGVEELVVFYYLVSSK